VASIHDSLREGITVKKPQRQTLSVVEPANDVVICGTGNIGSHFIDGVARLPGIGRVCVIDRDDYTEPNLRSQLILPADLGKPKAQVQARKLRRINPQLEVRAFAADLRAVPEGQFRCRLILSGLDSIAARIGLNRVARRMGAPWVDAGVDPSHQLARVSVFSPHRQRACFECPLSDVDYQSLGASHPCGTNPMETPAATQGSVALGQLAAALALIEAGKILAGHGGRSLFDHQFVMDTAYQAQVVTRLERRASCRCDHRAIHAPRLKGLTVAHTVKECLDAVAGSLGCRAAEVCLRLEGQAFCRHLMCPGCESRWCGFHLSGRLAPAARWCGGCLRARLPVAATMVDQIDASLPKAALRRPLRALGFLDGDIVRATVRPRRKPHYFEISQPS
jgi:molybdopterin/thiamine biosynthesis adenylyltransferase